MASTQDAQLDAYELSLARRTRRFHRYLTVRGWLGVGLGTFGVAMLAGALVIAGVGLGWWYIPEVARWTDGFGAILAPFMPAATGIIALRAGLSWWRHRHPDNDDTGCLVA